MTATTDVRYRPIYMYMYGCEWMFVYVCVHVLPCFVPLVIVFIFNFIATRLQ